MALQKSRFFLHSSRMRSSYLLTFVRDAACEGRNTSTSTVRPLQTKLKELGIGYAHLKELAPTDKIRAEQRMVDKQEKTNKRDRNLLSKGFIKAYRRDVLKVYKRNPENKFYAEEMLVRAQETAGYPSEKTLHRVVLFCVEREPSACHRSLLADELKKQLSLDIEHL